MMVLTHLIIIFKMKIFFYFASFIFILNLVLIKSDRALLFDLDENSIVQKETETSNATTGTICQNCAVACPTSNSEELTYNYENSVGKKALFVQDICPVAKNVDEIELPNCIGFIQASVILNKSTDLIEIGYEIHDTKNIVDSTKLKSKTDQFLSLYSVDALAKSQPKQIIVDYIKSGKKKFPQLKSTQSFIWIPVLFIDFNIDTMSPTRIEYKPDSGIHQMRDNCSQFFVGDEFYKFRTHYSAYSYENQRMLFTGKKDIPKEGLQCDPNYGCLVQHQIIPSYYFHSYYAARAVCTHMNTVPIWESIVKRINHVNRYLYAMTQIWKSYITITNGFFGIFKPSKKYFKKPAAERELYLDRTNKNKNIPVPMIFYKIVEYNISDVPRERDKYYNAVIVIHNDPTPDAGQERICAENNIVKGWEAIQNSDSRTGLTYVCLFSPNVIAKLKLVEKQVEGTRRTLELNEFLNYDPVKNWCLVENKKSEIMDKFKELFSNDKITVVENIN